MSNNQKLNKQNAPAKPYVPPQPGNTQASVTMGYKRQEDLLKITCALLSNQAVWPHNIQDSSTLVDMANAILLDVESREI